MPHVIREFDPPCLKCHGRFKQTDGSFVNHNGQTFFICRGCEKAGRSLN